MKYRKVKILPQGHTVGRRAEPSSEFQTQRPRVFPLHQAAARHTHLPWRRHGGNKVRLGARNRIPALAPPSATWVTLGKASHSQGQFKCENMIETSSEDNLCCRPWWRCFTGHQQLWAETKEVNDFLLPRSTQVCRVFWHSHPQRSRKWRCEAVAWVPQVPVLL